MKPPLSFVRLNADFIKRKEVLPEKAAKSLLAEHVQSRMAWRNNILKTTKWLTGSMAL